MHQILHEDACGETVSQREANHDTPQHQQRVPVIAQQPAEERRAAIKSLDDRLHQGERSRSEERHRHGGSLLRQPAHERPFPEHAQDLNPTQEHPAIDHALLHARDGVAGGRFTRWRQSVKRVQQHAGHQIGLRQRAASASTPASTTAATRPAMGQAATVTPDPIAAIGKAATAAVATSSMEM